MWCVLSYRQITFYPTEEEAKAASSQIPGSQVWNLKREGSNAICESLQRDKCPTDGWEQLCKEIERVCTKSA